jgi:hypothetical protein
MNLKRRLDKLTERRALASPPMPPPSFYDSEAYEKYTNSGEYNGAPFEALGIDPPPVVLYRAVDMGVRK